MLKQGFGENPRDPNAKDLALWKLAVSGSIAGGLAAFLLTPIELVKCRLQVQSSSAPGFRPYRGPIDVIVRTIRDEGIIRGLYCGRGSMLLRELPGNFCWYGVYEGVCKSRIPEGGTKRDSGIMTHLMAGSMAGLSYCSAFYTADTVKSLIQTRPEYATRGFLEILTEIYEKEGFAGFYRGWGITAIRGAMAHAILFAAYEQATRNLR